MPAMQDIDGTVNNATDKYIVPQIRHMRSQRVFVTNRKEFSCRARLRAQHSRPARPSQRPQPAVRDFWDCCFRRIGSTERSHSINVPGASNPALRKTRFDQSKMNTKKNRRALAGFYHISTNYPLPLIRGSSTSRMASPTRFQPITKKVRVKPG